MKNTFINLIEEYSQNHALPEACQLALQRAYPELLLRWSRIYGSRWAYLTGTGSETACLNPTRIRISREYGICIDNAEMITLEELSEIVHTLEECFAYAGNNS
jgi:hypothetical protein